MDRKLTQTEALNAVMPYIVTKLKELSESDMPVEADIPDAAYDAFLLGRETAARALAALQPNDVTPTSR